MTMRIEGGLWWTLCFLPEGSLVSGSLAGDIVTWAALSDTPRIVNSQRHSVFAMACSNDRIASGTQRAHLRQQSYTRSLGQGTSKACSSFGRTTARCRERWTDTR